MTDKERPKIEIEWTPISKDTPKEDGPYLTTTMFGEVYCNYWQGHFFDRSETIIAWAPMPEPYKWEGR